MTENGENLNVSVTVKNCGSYDAAATVKLFKAEKNAVNQPIKSLCRFEKIFIKKGGAANLTFTLTPDDFTHINQDGDKVYSLQNNFELFFE